MMEKINISELSIGDWVALDGADLKIEHGDIATAFVERARKPIRVQSIIGEDKLVLAHIEHFEGYGTIYSKEEHLRPIPITPEIVEANGWKCIEEDADDAFYGDPTSSLFHTKGTFRYNFATPEVSVVCHFVHQLQHALRLAGVEKEIVMPKK